MIPKKINSKMRMKNARMRRHEQPARRTRLQLSGSSSLERLVSFDPSSPFVPDFEAQVIEVQINGQILG